MSPPSPFPSGIEVRLISAEETIPLRLAVLRPGRPRDSAIFPGDDASCTRHYGAFRYGRLLSIASLYRAELPEKPGKEGYQLRGMATEAAARNQGLGRALVIACVEFARSQHVPILWCNARVTAVDFYRKLEFETIGPEFVIPDVGPHFRMWRKLKE